MSVTKNIGHIIKNLREYASLHELFNILNTHGEARLVGGCVRDMLMGYNVKDIDIAINLEPHIVQKILEEQQIRCIPTGIKFGTITALMDETSFQITSLRQDLRCDGRHATVSFSTDWEEDAKRRDFTFNALYTDLDGTIYDYHHGLSDLEQKRVRFIGEPEQRIEEDYLRILRYFRFLSYIGIHQIDIPSLVATQTLAENLSLISGERIQSEMLTLFGNKFAKDAFVLLCTHGIHHHLGMPALQVNLLEQLNMIQNEPLINLAAILKINKATQEQISSLSRRWRLSTKDRNLLQHLCLSENIFNTEQPIALHKQNCYRLGKGLYEKHALIYLVMHKYDQQTYDQTMSILNTLRQWIEPHFPISGEDLLAIGLIGEQVGEALRYMEDQWVASDFALTKEQLFQRLR